MNILSGGKPVNSQVKFAHFYLIVDTNGHGEANINACFKQFLSHLKSKFTTGKGGDTAFKVLPDGSFFNAFPSIADSFKQLEEAIGTSQANNHGASPDS